MNPDSAHSTVVQLHLFVGWLGMFLGIVSGAVIGLFFANDNWMGGYGSFRRRLSRLGHIAFFGMGFLNLFFAFTIAYIEMPPHWICIASISFVVSFGSMSLICFLTAWKKPMRHLFPIPVACALVGVIVTLIGLV